MYYQRNFELEYDLFIREGEGAESNMSARPLGDVPLGFYASPKYLQEYGHPRSISELNDNHRCLLGRMDRSNPWVDKMLGDLPFQWDWEIISNLTVCLISHAEEGLGVLFVAQHLVQRALERGTLVEVKLDIDLPKMPVTALYRREYLSPLARDCLDLLIKHMEENYPRELSPPLRHRFRRPAVLPQILGCGTSRDQWKIEARFNTRSASHNRDSTDAVECCCHHAIITL